MSAKVVELYHSNYRDPVAALRVLADEIENGDFGHVVCVGLSLQAEGVNRVDVFGMGEKAEVSNVALTLYRGFQLIADVEFGHVG